MLGIIFIIWAIGCFIAAVFIVVSHCTLGKTNSYYRCDNDYLEIITIMLLSWFSTYFYIEAFIHNFKNKPKDSCKKG